MELETLHARVRRCRKCILWKTRRKAVPGEGSMDARAMLIGEAPGRKEDESGRPFVGPSGKFLNGLLADNRLRREDMFITSTIKCIPATTGKPPRASIEACRPYLWRQIELVNPRIIVLLGGVATKTVLRIEKVSDVRGKILEQGERRFLATYHPSAGRRFPKLRGPMEKDFRLLVRHLNETG